MVEAGFYNMEGFFDMKAKRTILDTEDCDVGGGVAGVTRGGVWRSGILRGNFRTKR